MKISEPYVVQPFGHSNARDVSAGATEKQLLGWGVSAQDVLLKQSQSSSVFEQYRRNGVLSNIH